MPLYEILKADGTREKVLGYETEILEGALEVVDHAYQRLHTYAPGTWLEVWRREGVGE
jgi:hypothetical protein